MRQPGFWRPFYWLLKCCQSTGSIRAGSTHITERASRCLDQGGHNPRVLAESTDQVLRSADTGNRHQDEMESFASTSVRRFVFRRNSSGKEHVPTLLGRYWAARMAESQNAPMEPVCSLVVASLLSHPLPARDPPPPLLSMTLPAKTGDPFQRRMPAIGLTKQTKSKQRHQDVGSFWIQTFSVCRQESKSTSSVSL